MADDPVVRCTLHLEARGEDYDALVRDARRQAVAFLGPDRSYYLTITEARAEVQTTAGDVTGWVADASVTYPHVTF